MIRTIEKRLFLKYKKYLDGIVMWREVSEEQVEVWQVYPSKEVFNLLITLK